MSKLIASRAANALSTGADLRPGVADFLRRNTYGGANLSLGLLRKLYGGLWVGGTISVFDDCVEFKANGLNRSLQTGTDGFRVAWHEVSEVRWRPAILTSIIEIRHGDQLEAVRCFGSKMLAEQMKTLCATKVA